MKKLLLLVVSTLLINVSYAQWSAMGNPGGIVRALCVHNNELYAGGDFSGLVKKWNGTSWVAVGSLSGTSTPKVNCLISFNGVLYAGGSFTISGSVSGNVAKLVGTTWTATDANGLGGTTGTEVKCFGTYGGVLYAGGSFDKSGASFLGKIAKLVSGNWQQVGGGAPSRCQSVVNAIAEYYGELYVAGQGSAPWINKLEVGGAQWLELAAGGPSQGFGIYALKVMYHFPSANAQTLFIGGDFMTTPSNAVCKFYTGFWGTANSFSSGGKVNCFVTSANADSSILYAGGLFTAGTHTSSNIAKRTKGIDWDSAGTPTFGAVIRALCFYNGYLVAGGDFSSPGTYVARYSTTVGVEEPADNIILNTVYPNPIIKEALLKVETKNALLQPELKMLDVNGNEVQPRNAFSGFSRARNEVEFKIDREGLAPGIYYYMVLDSEHIIATGKVIAE